MSRKNISIFAIEFEKLNEFFEKNHLKEKFDKRRVKCEKCAEIITSFEDISYLYRNDGIKFVCNKNICQYKEIADA